MEREDPLYQGMTRDAMVLGVTLDCFILEVVVWSVAFLVTRSLWVLPDTGGRGWDPFSDRWRDASCRAARMSCSKSV